MTMKSLALSLASRGYRVFPITPNAKKPPLCVNGCHDGTTDVATIDAWWTSYPQANIGIAPDEGMVVIDIDRKDPDNDGAVSLAKIYDGCNSGISADGILDGCNSGISADGILDWCSVLTPSGGAHWYFLAPDPWANRVGVLPGVDVRAQGGYLVAPGSVIDGRAYEGQLPPRSSLPEITDPLLSLRTLDKARPKDDTPAGDMNEDRQVEAFVSWLKHHAPECEHGSRNDTVAKTLAPKARDLGVDWDVALPLVIEHWENDLEYDELALAMESGWNSAQNAPGSGDAINVFGDMIDPNAVIPEANAPSKLLLEPYFPGISERPEPKARLHPYLPRQELWLHSAPPKTMKTHFMMWIAALLSEGQEWAGHEFMNPGAVAYCLGEGTDSIAPRTDHIMRRLEVDQLPRFAVFPRVPHVKRPDTLAPFYEQFDILADAHDGLSLIVMDTARRVMSGGNISAEEDAGLLIEYGEDLARRYDCLTMFIHHPGKAKGNDNRGSAILESDPGVVTTHSVDNGMLWLNFKYHRYVDPADIPSLGWEVGKGELGPLFTWREGAKQPQGTGELINANRIMMIKGVLRECGLTLTAKELVERMMEQLPEDTPRQPIAKFLANAQRAAGPKELTDWRYQDGGRWYWKAPLEQSSDEILESLGF